MSIKRHSATDDEIIPFLSILLKGCMAPMKSWTVKQAALCFVGDVTVPSISSYCLLVVVDDRSYFFNCPIEIILCSPISPVPV